LGNMSFRNWIQWSVFNFLIVGLWGFMMRMKFLFPLPWIDQKNIMHAHSHFAFAGWVSQALMVFLILIVLGLGSTDKVPKKYQSVLWLNLLSSFCMLIAFSISGYAFFSIAFSFLVVLASYGFCYMLWKDLRSSSLTKPIITLVKAALLYHVLSSIGTYALVYLKVTDQLDPLKQLASVYFYLHFQYNGWFFFGFFALINKWLSERVGKNIISERFALIYSITVVPAYFLSVLWWKGFPAWLYGLLIVTVIVQLFLWLSFIIRAIKVKAKPGEAGIGKEVRVIWTCVALAVCMKLVLQAVSIIPSLSQLVYGFRPIVIAYLHLVLLVIISLFILAYAFQKGLLLIRKHIQLGIYGLLLGIFLNEFLLMLQGIGGLIRHAYLYTHEGLFLASGIMVLSLLQILRKQLSN